MALGCICVLLHLLLVFMRADSQGDVTSVGGPGNQLTAPDMNALETLVYNYYSGIDWSDLYNSGVVNQYLMAVDATHNNFWFRVLVYGETTCQLVDATPQPSLFISDLLRNELAPALKALVDQGSNHGMVVSQRVSIDFFQLPANYLSTPGNGLRRRLRSIETNGTTDANHKPASATPSDVQQFSRPPKTSRVPPTAYSRVRHRKDRQLVNETAPFTVFDAHRPRRSGLEGQDNNQVYDAQNNCNVIFTTLFSTAAVDDMSYIQTIGPGQSRRSANGGDYLLIMQDYCDLELLKRGADGGFTVTWRSKTAQMGTGCYATLELKGILTVRDGQNNQLWASSNPPCSSGENCWVSTALSVQTDGNVVLYVLSDVSLQSVWDTNNNPSL